MLMGKEFVAIIPARGGSKGIPRKNIINISGFPLIAYTIVAAKLSKFIDRVVVSTDDNEIAKIALQFGAEIPFLRPKKYATSKSTDLEFVQHALNWFQENEGNAPDYLVHLRPTTPLRDPVVIDKAIKIMLEDQQATALRSGYEIRESPYKLLKIEKGFFKGLFPDDPRPEYYNLPRQSFPSVYQPNGYVDILKSNYILNSGRLHGDKIIGFITKDVGELDKMEDLKMMEYLLHKEEFDIYKHLTNNFSKMSYNFSYIPIKVPFVKTKFRKIGTKIPAPGTVAILKKSLKYEPQSMNILLPLVWDKAIDYQVYDSCGNVWIDFTSGIFVANAGHSNEKITAAAKKVLEKPLLHSFLYPTVYRADLAEKLVKISPKGIDKALILSTGAEVTETALKIARIWGEKQSKKKNIIVAFEGSFHGETMGAKTMSGNAKAKEWIGEHDPNIVHLRYPVNYLESLDVEKSDYGEDVFKRDIKELGNKIELKNIAGFMLESYQGWAAMFFPRGYVKALRKFADKNNSLVMFDEVQAGFGRTGKLFAYQYYDIKPDVICCGKGISGGLPLSAVLSRIELLNVDSGGLNSTHAGNPVSCAAALANIDYLLKNKLPEKANEKGKIIYEFLVELQKDFPDRVKAIHGKGFAYAAIVVKPGTNELDTDFVDMLVETAFRKGVLLIRTGKGSIKLGPPLTIPKEALTEGLSVLRESFIECISKK